MKVDLREKQRAVLFKAIPVYGTLNAVLAEAFALLDQKLTQSKLEHYAEEATQE